MKKRTTLLVLCVTLLLGCSSDDEVLPLGNLLGVGASANDFLSNENFDRLLIEITCVSGFCPTGEAVANFQDFLKGTTFKENIVLTSFRELPSPNEETLTINEIAALESDNRTAFNQGNTLAVYIYFTDAPSSLDSENGGGSVLGAVYRNTSMVIFGPTIRGAASRFSLADVETATINHEFGHLLGLVNLGTPLLSLHEDEEAEGHCNREGCLMQGSLQLGGCGRRIMELMEYNASQGQDVVPVLDGTCIADLEGNGGRIGLTH